MENVERAMDDLRIPDGMKGRRGDEIQAGNIQVPATDYDFVSANAKFDKVALAPQPQSDSDSDSESDITNPENPEAKERKEKKQKEKPKESAYNPSKSFFDSLTANSAPRGNATRGGGRGRGRGRSRREEEAQRNLMTFGEAVPPSSNGFSRRGGRRGSGVGGGARFTS
jgi:protein LSM14